MKRNVLLLVVVMLVSMPLMAQEAEKSEGAGKTYTVKKGDTLWDISGVFLKDPFKWPDIWEKNPKVKDPHWIYPGDVLIILPSGEIRKKGAEEADSAPTKVKEAPELQQPRQEKREEVKEAVPIEAPAVAQPKPEEKAIEAAAPVSASALPVAIPVKTKQSFRYPGLEKVGFVSAEELTSIAKIFDAKEDKIMLSIDDSVFMDAGEQKGVKKGDRYTIYRIAAPVYHPVNKELVGHRVDILGAVEVTVPHDTYSEGQIVASYDVISRGDSIKSVGPVPAEIEIKKGEVQLEGLIVANKKGTVEMAEGDIVFLDKGKRAGVETGNTLIVYVSGRVKDKIKLPSEDVGRLLVLSTQEESSMALVIGTKKSFHVGDKVRMEN